jgi:hypothetical protein
MYLAVLGCVALSSATANASSDDVIAEVYIGMVTKDTNVSPYQYRINLGYKTLYVFGTYEEVKFNMLGQNWGAGTLTTVGVGGRFEILPKLDLFAEAGYGFLDYDTVNYITEEITYTELLNEHHVQGRTIPFGTCYDETQCNRAHEIEASSAPVFRVGLNWEPYRNITISLSQRFMTGDLYYRVYDLDIAADTGSWWENNDSINHGATELSIGIKW